MASVDWGRVRTHQFAVPDGVSRSELATELTRMLGSSDPDVRESTAVATLTTWIARGVYDDLLPGLGDGMTTGLQQGLGESGTVSVLRRSASVRVLRACLLRDQHQGLLPGETVLAWGDRLVAWFVRERDNRGVVPGRGPAYALGHGADGLAALAGSPHLGRAELTVLLDVAADRVTGEDTVSQPGDGDRLAHAVLSVLRRGEVPTSVVLPWINRVAAAAGPAPGESGPTGVPAPTTVAPQELLRSLHIQLTLGAPAPPDRGDLVLAVVAALRQTNPVHLAGPDQ